MNDVTLVAMDGEEEPAVFDTVDDVILVVDVVTVVAMDGEEEPAVFNTVEVDVVVQGGSLTDDL